MPTSLEVADIFRSSGPAYRAAHAGHLSLGQLKVMTAIENCRTAALGGHVEACDDCGHWRVAYNSCRNRHCPKCHGAAARTWLAAREADLLPVDYFHVVFTLPNEVADIAFQNKAVVYDLLFRAGCTTVTLIASWPMTQCMPIPESSPAQGTPTSKTTTVRTLTPHKVTLIRPEPTLPDQHRLLVRTTPQPLYP